MRKAVRSSGNVIDAEEAVQPSVHEHLRRDNLCARDGASFGSAKLRDIAAGPPIRSESCIPTEPDQFLGIMEIAAIVIEVPLVRADLTELDNNFLPKTNINI